MKFLVAMVLFGVPLAYAGLGELGGVPSLIEQEHIVDLENKSAARNESKDDLARTFEHGRMAVDNLGGAIASPARALSDNKLAENKLANATLDRQGGAKDELKDEAALEDSTAARALTGTAKTPDPEMVMEEKSASPASAINLEDARVVAG